MEFVLLYQMSQAPQVALWLKKEKKKKSACNAGDVGDVDSVLGQEGPLEEEMATHSSIPA